MDKWFKHKHAGTVMNEWMDENFISPGARALTHEYCEQESERYVFATYCYGQFPFFLYNGILHKRRIFGDHDLHLHKCLKRKNTKNW